MESIASQSPKDLTLLLEQISGSIEKKEEYEAAKEEYERTQEAITVVYNQKKGFGLEKREFKQQAEDAKRYDTKKKELEAAIIRHTLWKLYHLEKSAKELQHELDDAVNMEKKILEQLSGKESDVKQMQRDQAVVVKDIRVKEQQIQDTQKKFNASRPEYLKQEEKLKLLGKKLSTMHANVLRLEKEKARKEALVGELQKQLDDVSKAKSRHEQKVQTKSGSIQLTEKQQQEYASLKAKADNEAFAHIQDRENIKREMKIKDDTLKRITSKITELNQSRIILQEAKSDLEEFCDKVLYIAFCFLIFLVDRETIGDM